MSQLEDKITALVGEKALCDPAINSDLALKIIEYDPKGAPNSQRALNQATMEGLDVVFPADNELFVDIDNAHSYMLFCKQFDIVNKHIGVEGWQENISKSGNPDKKHITIQLSVDVTPMERLALQAMLGSDRVRELLGYVQEKNGDPYPVLFLEKPKVAGLLKAAPETVVLGGVPIDEEGIPY